jgi:hypothetical protein
MKKYLTWAGAALIVLAAFKAFQINKQKTRGSYKKNY